MIYSTIAGDAGPRNTYTISSGFGNMTTLDESPPTFTKLEIQDPTAANDRIVVTFQLNEPGTAFCRPVRSDSNVTSLKTLDIISAGWSGAYNTYSQVSPVLITMSRIEVDTNSPAIVEAQYDVYCWAQDTAVDSAGH